MSSIAYITDKKMIEFHRLNGNDTINFWRPSSSKRFTDFQPGDLLFFLAKGTERGPNKEKGLIGYGRYTQAVKLSFRQMWNHYGLLNGYPNEAALKEAILKVSKEKTLIHPFSCLKLTNLVFFQSPVYLSELGLHISSNLESYIYLDKEDIQTTTRILLKAKQVGIDSWTSVVSQNAPSERVFSEDLIRHNLTLTINELPQHNKVEDWRKAQKILVNHQKNHPQLHWLDDRKSELFGFEGNELSITSVLIATKTEQIQKLLVLVGKANYLSHQAMMIPDFKDHTLRFKILCDLDISEEWRTFLHDNHIDLIDFTLAGESTDNV
jgi:hypothetical protein